MQLPQWVVSVWRFAQTARPPPKGWQSVSPVGQALQTPLVHVWPTAHWMPHPPQLSTSVVTVTQMLPVPLAQDT